MIVSPILLNQVTLGLVTQIVLFLALGVYLFTLPAKEKVTWRICAAVFLAVAMIGLLLVEIGLVYPHPWRRTTEIAVWIFMLPIGVLVLSASYEVWGEIPLLQREAKWITRSATVVALPLCWLALAVWRTNGVWFQTTTGIFSIAYVLLLLIWSVGVLWRRCLLLSDEPTGHWLSLLLSPQRPDALALRNLGLALASTLVILGLTAFWTLQIFPPGFMIPTLGILITLALFVIGLIYLSHLREPTTILAKLVSISLFTLMVTFSFIGMWGTLVVEQTYQPLRTPQSHAAIRYQPTAAGGYRLFRSTLVPGETLVNTQLGEPILLNGDTHQPLILPFPFPFYGDVWAQIYVHQNGLLTFAQPYDYQRFIMHLQPAIAPLLTHMQPLGTDGQGTVDDGESGLFWQSMPEQVTITWLNMVNVATGAPNTFQVRLWANGEIELRYYTVAATYAYRNEPLDGLWLIGILPGNGTLLADQARTTSTQSTVTEPSRAVVDFYYLDFRRHLQQQLLPLLWLILGASAFLLIGFPFFFQITLIKPLAGLVQGIRRVNVGDFTVIPTPHFNDEIGFLTSSFAAMVASLRKQRDALQQANATLELQVEKRTEELSLSNQALVQARDEAEAANRAKSHFLATMSHELRTPLNAIMGYAQLLQDGRAQEKGAQIIEQSGRHLLLLINDLLDIAKIEAGKHELYPTWLSLPGFLQEIGEMIEVRTQAKGLAFQIETDPALPKSIYGDERRLRQILVNLLGNAVKFTETGSVTLSVRGKQLATSQLGADVFYQLHFAVTDTGIGIAPAQLDAIFRPFEQVGDGSAQANGIGLGLTISQRLVELMGGTLAVESQLGQGSTFQFAVTVPIHGPTQPPVVFRAVSGVIGTAPTVLVVDDNLYNRRLLVDFLTPLGMQTLEAADGEVALHLLHQHRPSILLVDLVMPVMDGFTLIKEVRADDLLCDVVIIAVSASISAGDEVHSLQRGADAFLRKPIDFAQLVQILEELAGIEWVETPQRQQQNTMPHKPMFNLSPPAHQLSTHQLSTEQLSTLLTFAQQGDIVAVDAELKQLEQCDDDAIRQLGTELQLLAQTYQIQKLVQRLTRLIEQRNVDER